MLAGVCALLGARSKACPGVTHFLAIYVRKCSAVHKKRLTVRVFATDGLGLPSPVLSCCTRCTTSPVVYTRRRRLYWRRLNRKDIYLYLVDKRLLAGQIQARFSARVSFENRVWRV